MKRKALVGGDLLLSLAAKRQHLPPTTVPRSSQECKSQDAVCLPCYLHPHEAKTKVDDDNMLSKGNEGGNMLLDRPVEVFEDPSIAVLERSKDCVNDYFDCKQAEVTNTDKANAPTLTGLVFEAANNHFDQHHRLHPERPDRIKNIFNAIQQDQTLLSRCRILLYGNNADEHHIIDRQDFLRVHSSGYLQRLERISKCDCTDRLDMEAGQYQSVYLTADSLQEAEKASRSLCLLVASVIRDEFRNGFAVIRPPGHHAQGGMAGGYCLINHVAVAASYANTKLGVPKILIVDWDAHHGNGTQEIFYDSPNILYISVHRWDVSNFFPFSATAGPTHVGKHQGIGYNVNVGWSRKGMGDAEYLAAWNHLVMPLAREFSPDLVLVSAGFDAAQGDMGECDVTPRCFGQMTQMLMTLANGRVVCTLEGGYKRSILTNCVVSVLQSLTGMSEAAWAKQDDESGSCWDDIDDSANRCIDATKEALRPFWKCLQIPVVESSL